MSELSIFSVISLLGAFFSFLLLSTYKSYGGKITKMLGYMIITYCFAVYSIYNNLFSIFELHNIAFFAYITGLVVFIVGCFFMSNGFRTILLKIPVSTLLKLQFIRAPFGIMFFFAVDIPGWFQYVGGIGDIMAGVFAAIAWFLLTRKTISEKSALWLGNIVGMIDFMIVFTAATFIVLPNAQVTFMFNIIPLYVVPMFMVIHFISLYKLFTKRV